MRFILSILSVLLFVSVGMSQAQEGVISKNSPWSGGSRVVGVDEAARSAADWKDMRQLNGAVDTQSVINTVTKWRTNSTDTMYVKCIYNASATATVIRMATLSNPTPGAADTIRYALGPYQSTIKLPALAKIFKLASTDSIINFYQLFQ
jgi:hypothetical protein